MSRGKQFTRRQQREAEKAKRGLGVMVAQDPLAAKISSRAWIFDEYRKLYNELCPACRALVQRTGGKAELKDYCPACQQKAIPRLRTINTMLKGPGPGG